MSEALPNDVEQRIADAPPETRELYRAVDFGMEVQAFVGSRIGKYLIGRAEEEAAAATEALKDIEPEDSTGVRRLQNLVKRAEGVQYWMAEAIQAGLDAQRQIMEQEAD